MLFQSIHYHGDYFLTVSSHVTGDGHWNTVFNRPQGSILLKYQLAVMLSVQGVEVTKINSYKLCLQNGMLYEN